MLRNIVSSNTEVLNTLHNIYNFLPDYMSIRPTEQVIQKKIQSRLYIDTVWRSERDFIKSKVFRIRAFIGDNNRICTTDDIIIDDWIFKPSQFPYNINGNHWILWKYSNTMTDFEINENNIKIINDIIIEQLRNINTNDNFDFGWYPNPKPSIPDFFHVHVFWK